MKQLSKSYMLRTGQMRLHVRAIKPVTQELPAVIQELPEHPTIGEYYLHKGEKVKCIEYSGCDECICYAKGCNAYILTRCMASRRIDGKSVIFIKAD